MLPTNQPRPFKAPLKIEKKFERISTGIHAGSLAALVLTAAALAFGTRIEPAVLWTLIGLFAVASLLSLFIALRPDGFWRLRQRVAYDKLTAVLDRASFTDKLHAEIRRAGRYHFPLTVCLLDVDDFEELNRKNGKYYGDEVLQKFAQISLGHIRSSDFLGRAGRDEFLILLSHTDLTQAEKFLYRLYLQIQERLDLSFSAGITSYRPGESGQEMLRRSEQALERAQQEGQRKTRCLICKDDSRVVMNFDFGKMPG